MNQRMTLTLEQVLNIITIDELFNFEYNWEDVDTYTKEYMQTYFKDWWVLNEIAFETIDQFRYYLRRQWLSTIENVNRLLKVDVKNIEFVSQTRTRDLDRQGDNEFSDTPNQNIAGTDKKYLSNMSKNVDKANEVEKLTNNPTMYLKQLRNNIITLMADWVKSFDDLFLTHITIKKGVTLYDRFS